MATPRSGKKYFTVAEANSMLPLVRVIVRDICELAGKMRERHERLERLYPNDRPTLSDAHAEEEIQQAESGVRSRQSEDRRVPTRVESTRRSS